MGDLAGSGEVMTDLSGSNSAAVREAFIPASGDCSGIDGVVNAPDRSGLAAREARGLDADLRESPALVFGAPAAAPDVWVTFTEDSLAAMGSARVSVVCSAVSAPGFAAATGVDVFFWLGLFAEDPCDFGGDFLSLLMIILLA